MTYRVFPARNAERVEDRPKAFGRRGDGARMPGGRKSGAIRTLEIVALVAGCVMLGAFAAGVI